MGSRIVKKGNVRHVRLTVCRVMSERSASFAAGVLCISCEATSGRSGESSSRGRRLSGPCLSTVTVSAWRWNASTSVFLMHRHLQTLLDQYDSAVTHGFLHYQIAWTLVSTSAQGRGTKCPSHGRTLSAGPACLMPRFFAVVLVQNVLHPFLQVSAPSSKH
jgi:hypothetical protein